jgi:hypothetical protein
MYNLSHIVFLYAEELLFVDPFLLNVADHKKNITILIGNRYKRAYKRNAKNNEQ